MVIRMWWFGCDSWDGDGGTALCVMGCGNFVSSSPLTELKSTLGSFLDWLTTKYRQTHRTYIQVW